MAPLVEAQSRHLVIRPFLGAELERSDFVNLADALINSPSFFARLTIRILVDILPIGGRIGPRQEIKALKPA